MTIHTKELEIVNKAVYENLEKFLKKLNKRIHLKLYSLVYDDKGELDCLVRVKKTVGKTPNAYVITHDILPDLDEIYRELKLKLGISDNELNSGTLKDCFDQKKYEPLLPVKPTLEADDADASEEEDLTAIAVQTDHEDKRVLYANHLKYADGTQHFTLLYILEISNVDPVSRDLFYHKPQYSFLRMALDYFFLDFFSLDEASRI